MLCCALMPGVLSGTWVVVLQLSGGAWTGAALNPARVLGPLAVFGCGKDVWWIYVLAQLTAAILACCVFAFVSGLGPLNPYTSTSELGLSWPEAIKMWVTGKSLAAPAASSAPLHEKSCSVL
jgi:Major intrinsic protein